MTEAIPTPFAPFSAPISHILDETLFWLCDIPSPIGEEETLCNRIVERLERRSLGGAIRRFGNSIVVPVARRADGRPHIALAGHLDTVRTENGPARLDGDRCFGAGASDMKSGLAVMLILAETLARDALPCDLTLVFYAREEGPFAENELGVVLEQDPELTKVDLAVCMEPSNNWVHLGCSGSIHATVTFEGRTGHSARPWEADNAIVKAAELLRDLQAITPAEETIDGLVFRTVTTVTQAKDGGRGRNVVPDVFTLNLNHRFAPTISIDRAKQNVIDLVKGKASVTFTDVSPAAMPNAAHPLIRALIGAGVRGVQPKQAWTDVARFASLGVPAVNFGPGENAQAHQKNESTSLQLVHEGYAIMHRWITTLGNQ